jgi:hypothetical protein
VAAQELLVVQVLLDQLEAQVHQVQAALPELLVLQELLEQAVPTVQALEVMSCI